MKKEPFGYIILRNIHLKIESPNSTEWQICETGFQLDYVKKKLYKQYSSAEDAMKQLKKHTPEDDFIIQPIYLE